MLLRRERQLGDVVAGRLPARNAIEDEQPLQHLAVVLHGAPRRLGLVAASGGAADLLERRGGRAAAQAVIQRRSALGLRNG